MVRELKVIMRRYKKMASAAYYFVSKGAKQGEIEDFKMLQNCYKKVNFLLIFGKMAQNEYLCATFFQNSITI